MIGANLGIKLNRYLFDTWQVLDSRPRLAFDLVAQRAGRRGQHDRE